jgi:hypothetical protein
MLVTMPRDSEKHVKCPEDEGRWSTSFARHAPDHMDIVDMSATVAATFVASRHPSADYRYDSSGQAVHQKHIPIIHSGSG